MGVDPLEQKARVWRFNEQLVVSLGNIVVELGKALDGKFSDETRRAIHEQLRPLSEAALDLPEGIPSALPVFDLLVGMFPPPAPSAPPEESQ